MERQARFQRGAVLIDAMLGIYILAIMAMIYSATIEAAVQSRYIADQHTKALMAADREMEAIRALGYGNAQYNSLIFYNLIDTTSSQSPFSFTNAGTSTEQVSSMLPNGTGTVTITDVNPTLRQVTVTVSWLGRTGAHSYTVSTQLAMLE